jgi:membrane fusion protein
MSELFRREAVQHATRRLSGEVVLATPLSVKTLGLFLSAVVFGVALFASLASYARKATVTGLLVPDQGMIRVTLQSPGTLQSVMVKEGDLTNAGDRLAVVAMGAETVGGNVGDVVAKGLSAEAAAAKAKAQSVLAKLQVEGEQAKIRLSKNKIELKQIMTQLDLQQTRVDFAKQELTRAEQAAEKGFMSKFELNNRRSNAIAQEQELASLRRQVATIEREAADIEARLASIPHETSAAQSEAQTAEASLLQRSADAESRRSQFVTAPVSGRVAALPVMSGQTIAAGSTIAVIVPEGSRIEAELLAPSRSIGFIKPGQDVNLILQAFPHQRFGTLAGTVRTVSSTVLAPNEVTIQGLDIREPVFRIRVSLSRDAMQAYGESIALQPGMLVSAEVVFDRRSLMQWLFDPIYAVRGRS